MRGNILAVGVSMWLFLPGAPASPAIDPGNSCLQCHEYIGGEMGKPVSLWYGSIHQDQGITCDQCHGGNPDFKIGDLKKSTPQQVRNWAKGAMYSAPNFVGAPSGQAQFDLCATCHPDSAKVYTASIMGQAYLLKKGGPSCTQCHGAHRNVIPAVPQVCKGCHKDVTGFDRLPAMNITEAKVRELAHIRIQVGEEKVAGKGPLFQRHLESFETGLVSWSMVILLFLAAVGLYYLVERTK
jgi:Cytochrome c3